MRIHSVLSHIFVATTLSGALSAYTAQNTQTSHVWHNKGGSLSNLQRNEQAIAAYDRAIQISNYYSELIDLNAADSWFAPGRVLYTMKKYQEAVSSFDKAISMRSDFADAVKARNVAQQKLK
jgi:tetratricopeptide (TPR) repeat protein